MVEERVPQEQRSEGAPPYISQATFITFLDWIKDFPLTPSQIDRSLWEDKFAGSTGTQLMQGLRFLGLLDGSKPTPKLDQLARADNDGRRPLLEKMLRDAYDDAAVDGLRTDTPRMFDDKLVALGTTSATHRKAASFFINVAKIAGLEIQPTISKRARVRAGLGTGKRTSASRRKPAETDEPGRSQEESAERRGLSQPHSFDLHPTLVGLLNDLERIGPLWQEAERNRWIATFNSLLDYAYPTHERTRPQDLDGAQIPLTKP